MGFLKLMKPSGNLSVWPQCGHYTTTVIVIWATRVNEEAQEQLQGTDLQSIPCLHCALIMISFLVMLPSPLIFQINCASNSSTYCTCFTCVTAMWQQWWNLLLCFLFSHRQSCCPAPNTTAKRNCKSYKTTKDTWWKHNPSSRQWLENVPLR